MASKRKINDLRIAWLVPTAIYGAYWPPILHKLNQQFKQLKFFTGQLWPKFNPDIPGTSVIQVVGQTKFVEQTKTETGYSRGFMMASPTIAYHLLRFRPNVIFASGFSLWTLLAILLKPFFQWRIVLVYEGSAPNVDFRDSTIRLFCRRMMVKFANTFISNSHAGKKYLIEVLGVAAQNISATPYMVPDAQALLKSSNTNEVVNLQLYQPIFLFIGQVTKRKGLHLLLSACGNLHEQGYSNYSLLIVGDGSQRSELEAFCTEQGLQDRVTWLGWVAYEKLGAYLEAADVFVFPTLEDTWGMVVLEAMAFGKPVLCSKWAGVKEILVEGDNGYLFDPNDSKELMALMSRFIEKPELIQAMGEKSRQIISQYTPESVAKLISKVTSDVMRKV